MHEGEWWTEIERLAHKDRFDTSDAGEAEITK